MCRLGGGSANLRGRDFANSPYFSLFAGNCEQHSKSVHHFVQRFQPLLQWLSGEDEFKGTIKSPRSAHRRASQAKAHYFLRSMALTDIRFGAFRKKESCGRPLSRLIQLFVRRPPTAERREPKSTIQRACDQLIREVRRAVNFAIAS